MRIEEATALQWIDIDFEKNYIIVRRNIPHHRQVQTTKTEASQRKVDMSPDVLRNNYQTSPINRFPALQAAIFSILYS
jgi:hypothetical protein